jgi:hypothetical protein
VARERKEAKREIISNNGRKKEGGRVRKKGSKERDNK